MTYEAETLERAALESLHAAATPAVRRRLGLAGHEIAGAFVSVASRLPATAIVINRVVGLGLSVRATEEDLAAIVDTYRRAGVARYFVQIRHQVEQHELTGWLAACGLVKARGWQKFTRGTAPIAQPETDLVIRRVGVAHGSAFGHIACDAFDLGTAAIPWLATLPEREGWHVFMSFDGDEPAGTGALYIKDGLAWTDFGATAPRFRQRGSQSALLAARVRHAIELGCTAIHTCTGEDVPGDPQHSYRNILKAGFREDYLRENYAPPSGHGGV